MNIEETRNEILSRTKSIKAKQNRRIRRGLKASLGVLMLALIVVLQYLPNAGNADKVSGNYATLALGSEIGMYIIVGIVCFLIGVVITLLAVKARENNIENR